MFEFVLQPSPGADSKNTGILSVHLVEKLQE